MVSSRRCRDKDRRAITFTTPENWCGTDQYARLVIRPLGDKFARDLGHVMSHDVAKGICHEHYIRTPLF